jgi:hypothetical protein
MNNRDILATYFIHQPGLILYPKADGRVEIPQFIVKGLEWDNISCVCVHMYPGELILSVKKNLCKASELLGKINVTKGRIRIPLGFLKKSGFEKRPVVLGAGSDGSLIIRPDRSDVAEDIRKFIDNNLSENLTNDLASLLIGKPDDSGEASPILFLPAANSLCFRPIAAPYRFAGFKLKNGELVTTSNHKSSYSRDFYLIPGIKRSSGVFKPGFLLTSEHLFSIINSKIVHPINYDLIILNNGFDFKVYRNPVEVLSQDIIKESEQICSNPGEFIKKFFRKVDKFDWNKMVSGRYPTLVHLENVKYST